VLLVNLEVAAKRGESAAVTASTEQLADVLGSVRGAVTIATQARTATTPRARKQLTSALEEQFPNSHWYKLGIWLGQARLAAAARDLSFFAPNGRAAKELRRVRDQLTADTAIQNDSNSVATLNQINTLLEQISAAGYSSTTPLSVSLESLLTTAASIR
jgi:hypothetical protein